MKVKLSTADHLVNKLLLDLYKKCRVISRQEFLPWVMERMQEIIPFTSAFWSTSTTEALLTVHTLYLYNQPLEMMENYHRQKDKDFFLEGLQKSIGKTVDVMDLMTREEFIKTDVYRNHCKKYGMEHSISTHIHDVLPNLFTILSLYRDDERMSFTKEEKSIKQILMQHLVEAEKINLFVGFRKSLMRNTGIDGKSALCDRQGLLSQVEPGFSELLADVFPVWEGPFLPSVMRDALEYGEDVYINDLIVRIDNYDDLYIVHVHNDKLACLTAREAEIVKLLSNGMSNKMVARELNLSPSTIGNHINNIFRKTGACNRVQLASLLGQNG